MRATVLRSLSDSDSDLLFRWINDRDLVILNAPFRMVARADHDRWFASIRRAPDIRIYAIADPSQSRAIGYCQLKRIDRESGNAELQIRIGERAMHGKGIGTMAVRELLAVGFEELALHRIYLHVFEDNERAYRTYLGCGFREEGLLRDAVKIEGAFKNIRLMAILDSDGGPSIAAKR